MPRSPVSSYLATLSRAVAGGGRTERSHYSTLEALVRQLRPGAEVVVEGKRIECGTPDFDIRAGQLRIGYVEAKDVGLNLDEAAESEQLKKRYLPALPSLVLTNYLEFRWYVRGELRETAVLGRLDAQGKVKAVAGGADEVAHLLTQFLSHTPTGAENAKDLAMRLAGLAREIHNIILAAFQRGAVSDELRGLMQAMEQYLLPDLTEAQFADMFAQTLAYGFFAARCNHPTRGHFTRREAAVEIPKTNPFLRRLFSEITGPTLDEEPFVGYVDDLIQLLGATAMDEILADFGRDTARADPIIHFYETFLKEYDPALRELRGVYYTPEPVISYMVRSVDHLLRTRFGCTGLADTEKVTYRIAPMAQMSRRSSAGQEPLGREVTSPRVLILDPACGTGTFLYGVVNHIREQFRRQRDAGSWSGYVKDHLLPRLFGFELLMAPYAVAHLKLGLELAGQDMEVADRADWSYDFASEERLGIYLTNTLDQAAHRAESLFGYLRTLSEEANAAADVKHDKPIMVVIGNPPYSGHSANRSWEKMGKKRVPTFIGKLLQDYYQVDGQPLNERNPKWLQDDYVKFLRFGQWRIEQTGEGILAFITNHGYLDNPTFRGMRQQLMQAFSDIYILDLHGNSKKKERTPEGGKDENVFDIQQGVCITLFVKERGTEGPARVWHADLWGEREAKYEALQEGSVEKVEWQQVHPETPAYLFVPQDDQLLPEYRGAFSVVDIFGLYASTVTTARNDFAMAYESDTLAQRIADLRNATLDDDAIRERYGLRDVSYWSLRKAREELSSVANSAEFIRLYCYRPFDFRFVFYHPAICERLRPEVMAHMRNSNLALLTHRPQSPGDFTFAYCTRLIGDQCVAANKTAGGGNSFQFPLFLQSSDGEATRTPNLNPTFIADLQQRLGLSFVPDGTGDLTETFGPEDVFDYIYAVLHSPTYRTRYAEFLKRDFPRIPLTSARDLFAALVVKGRELVALHLLESPLLEVLTPGFPITGSDVVEKVQYNANEQSVYLNKERQHFTEVPPEVWSFHVGGYQVCDKWLKDRKRRALSYDDQVHYRKIVVALGETIRVMGEIDARIPGWPME